MPAPSRLPGQSVHHAVDWIGSRKFVLEARPLEDLANPLPYPPRGLGLRHPDRRKHLDDITPADRVDGTVPKERECVGGERTQPLRRMHFVSPGWRGLGAPPFGHLAERRRAHLRKLRLGDRVATKARQAADALGCFRKLDDCPIPQNELALTSLDDNAQQQAPRARISQNK